MEDKGLMRPVAYRGRSRACLALCLQPLVEDFVSSPGQWSMLSLYNPTWAKSWLTACLSTQSSLHTHSGSTCLHFLSTDMLFSILSPLFLFNFLIYILCIIVFRADWISQVWIYSAILIRSIRIIFKWQLSYFLLENTDSVLRPGSHLWGQHCECVILWIFCGLIELGNFLKVLSYIEFCSIVAHSSPLK